MGSLSGSAVANVVTTGSLTIPVMKRAGFRPHFAGAIEAAASTGGQLMPPIMGAGAFILATWTNIPYFDVAAAAAIPAVLYYVALFMAIHFKARQMGLPPEPPQKILSVLPRIHLLLSLGVIVALLAMGRSPMRAAFWGAVSALVLTGLRQQTRLSFDALGHALLRAASGTVQVAAACAAAGIVVGVASLTGIGLRMSELIVTLSGGYLPLALILTALGSIVLGMGLPTTAAYVVLAALGAPALISLGTPVLAAHLFIFYFGCLSNVTPPVSLAAYAAAGIANAPPHEDRGHRDATGGLGVHRPLWFRVRPGATCRSPAGRHRDYRQHDCVRGRRPRSSHFGTRVGTIETAGTAPLCDVGPGADLAGTDYRPPGSRRARPVDPGSHEVERARVIQISRAQA